MNSLVFKFCSRFLFPDIVMNDQSSDRQFIKLRHPQTGDLAIFVYSENDKKLAQMRSLPFSHRYILTKISCSIFTF